MQGLMAQKRHPGKNLISIYLKKGPLRILMSLKVHIKRAVGTLLSNINIIDDQRSHFLFIYIINAVTKFCFFLWNRPINKDS